MPVVDFYDAGPALVLSLFLKVRILMLSDDLGLIVRAFRPQFGSYCQDSEGYAIADVPPFSNERERGL